MDLHERVQNLEKEGIAVIAWWKNNSFSEVAILADEYKDSLKAEGYNVKQ